MMTDINSGIGNEELTTSTFVMEGITSMAHDKLEQIIRTAFRGPKKDKARSNAEYNALKRATPLIDTLSQEIANKVITFKPDERWRELEKQIKNYSPRLDKIINEYLNEWHGK